MNIMDFVDSIKLQISDLENVGKIGYVEGISNIITTNLKAMDVTQRPVHCTDQKREVLYIKDEDKWEKEDDARRKIKKAIKRVVSKNQRLLPQFKEIHPDCNRASSRYSDQYNKFLMRLRDTLGQDYSRNIHETIPRCNDILSIRTNCTSLSKNTIWCCSPCLAVIN
jgi:hypothetical protein